MFPSASVIEFCCVLGECSASAFSLCHLIDSHARKCRSAGDASEQSTRVLVSPREKTTGAGQKRFEGNVGNEFECQMYSYTIKQTRTHSATENMPSTHRTDDEKFRELPDGVASSRRCEKDSTLLSAQLTRQKQSNLPPR